MSKNIVDPQTKDETKPTESVTLSLEAPVPESSATEANDKKKTQEKETEEVSERSIAGMRGRIAVSERMFIMRDCLEILRLTLVPHFDACLLVSNYPIIIGRFSKPSGSIERVFRQLEFG